MRFSSRAFTAYATFFVLLGLVDQATARVGGGSPEDNDSPRDRQLLLELAEDNPIAGQYMVLFKPTPIVDLQATISTLVATLPGVSVLFTYEYTIQGVALGGITDPILSLLAGNGLVDMIVQDSEISLEATTTQNSPPWGLDRLDQVDAPPYDQKYSYSCTGSDVWVYVLDTGIRPTHNDFGNRAVCGPSFVSGENDCVDGNGHGTHCAGTVAGTTYGVAKEATVVGVKVLSAGGSGSISGVIAGVDYVAGQKSQNPSRKVVGSMSLGGGRNTALDNAVNSAVNDHGVVMVVAAGNDNDDACNYSPARSTSAITVGATTNQDARAGYSNFGSCVDVFAPGSGILSTWFTSDTATRTLSGTSMATPHVAGVAALYLQAGSNANQMIQDATPDTISGVGSGSPNLMSYTGAVACGITNPDPSPPPPTPSPVVVNPPPAPTAPACSSSGASCSSGDECCSGSCNCVFFCLFGGRECAV